MSVAMDDRYSCQRCGAEFTSPDELLDHTAHVHEAVRVLVVAG